MSRPREDVSWSRGAVLATAALAAGWIAVAYLFAAAGGFTAGPATVLRPIALAALVPPALFLLAYGLSARTRALVLALDPVRLTMLQQWRVMGFAFILLYAHGVLPGVFAWPAGLGDVAVGLTAAWVVARLARDPGFLRAPGFVAFHLAGILDFAVAVIAAGLTAGAYPGLLSDGVTGAAMEAWPLNLFPLVIVPGFLILHLAVLLRLRHAAVAAATGAPA